MKLRRLASLALTLLMVVSMALPVGATAVPAAPVTENVKVHVLGIGQGDSIFIELPDKTSMLVDVGNPGDGPAILQYIKGLGYTKLDYLVATHPHADHIGGMTDVVKGIGIGKIYMPDATTTTQTFENLLDAIAAKGLKITKAKAGIDVLSTDKLKISFVAPVGTQYTDLNNYSAALKITYGTKSFLLMGDAEKESEAQISTDIKADVLKVGHHGSDTSTSAAFLTKVKPTYAVISVGAENSYGHPAATTLQALQASGATVYRTDKDGTVIFAADGIDITVSRAAAVISSSVTAQPTVPSVSGTAPSSASSESSKVTPSVTSEANKQDQTEYVWITATGSKYHSIPNCGNTKSATEIPLQDAIARGYDACKRCH